MPPILYLIDGHALAYRNYFALTSGSGAGFSTSTGIPTAGTFGFTSSLLRLMEQEQPEYLAVTFDTGKTFRDEIFPEYKATRAKMPDDLREQMGWIRKLVDVLDIPRLEVEGYEADDVLGSIAQVAVQQGFGVKIITGDRDLLQLVNERVIVSLPGKSLADSTDYTPSDVKAYLGVRPDQVVDYKALVGDTSDNIPGVQGIGQKTAESLFEKYDTLDEIYAHLDELPKRAKSLLETGRENAYLSQKLARIHTDVKITLNLEDARTDKIDLAKAEPLFKELEFNSMLKRLRALKEKAISAPAPAPGGQPSLFGEEIRQIGSAPEAALPFHIIDEPQKLSDLVQKLSAAPVISFDTETTSTDPMQADLVGISLAVDDKEGYYIPVGHRTNAPQLELDHVSAALKPIFADPHKNFVGHNMKYDALVLLRHGIPVDHCSFDTMIAEWLADPASHHLGLKDMALHHLDIEMTHIEALIGKGKAQISMADVPIESAAPYASADAQVPLLLLPKLEARLKNHSAEKLFHELEMPLVPILMDMEKTGISLDVPFYKKMASELSARLGELEKQIFDAVGYTFNLNSTQQLSKALFEKLRLQAPGQKKTSSGHFSTSAAVLDDLKGRHPVVDLLLEYRELSKIKSTYVDTLPLQVNPHTGRVHTSFNQTGSVTGRLASSDPNLQNIPIRTEIGQQVRHGFVAEAGHVLLSVDYSQIELRIVAHMSGDETMLEAFRQNQDIHATTAAAIYAIPLKEVTKEQRRHAKAINFGLIYGMSAFGLSNTTGLTLAEAEDFEKAYFQEFRGVKKYLDHIKYLATEQGYVETLLGRRRYFPNLRSQTNFNLRRREEREAINAPIQGSAADIMKLAMLHVPAALKAAGLHARLLLQVHDELILECTPAELAETVRLVQKTMESAYQLSIPLTTEARSGINWGVMNVVEPQ
jgi:DNA polymerase-1